MKKYILFISVLFLFSSCNLDINPEDEVAGDDAIDNTITAREALNTAYSNYPKSNMSFSLLSEDFFPTYLISRSYELNQLYKWNYEQIRTLSDQMWNGYYQTISNINVLLASEKYITQNVQTKTNDWDIIKGEAYALKAMAYFDLLNIYSDNYNDASLGIILKDKVELEFLPRSSAKECIAEIERLLQEARKLLLASKSSEIHVDTRRSNYLNYYATVVLSARVALYKKDYASAELYCNEVINDVGYTNTTVSQSDYLNTWTDSNSPEKLFAFDTETFILGEYNESKTLGDYIAVSTRFDFGANDVRHGIATFSFEMKANGQTELITRNLIGKYRTSITDFTPKDVCCIRVAEVYFILGEIYAQQQNYDKARNSTNILLAKRGAEIISATLTGDALKNRIFEEKQKEFVGEGLNYFDLKRLGKNIQRYNTDSETVQSTIEKSDFRRLFPIPLSELKQNKKAVQNKDWADI